MRVLFKKRLVIFIVFVSVILLSTYKLKLSAQSCNPGSCSLTQSCDTEARGCNILFGGGSSQRTSNGTTYLICEPNPGGTAPCVNAFSHICGSTLIYADNATCTPPATSSTPYSVSSCASQ